MRRFWECLLSLAFTLILYGLLMTGIHEQAHYLGAKAVGIEGGYVTFGLMGGNYHFPEGLHPQTWRVLIVDLSGGLGTALLFAGLWYLVNRQLRYTIWEIDDSFALMALATIQIVYALVETFLPASGQNWGRLVALGAGLALAWGFYGKGIKEWIAALDSAGCVQPPDAWSRH